MPCYFSSLRYTANYTVLNVIQITGDEICIQTYCAEEYARVSSSKCFKHICSFLEQTHILSVPDTASIIRMSCQQE